MGSLIPPVIGPFIAPDRTPAFLYLTAAVWKERDGEKDRAREKKRAREKRERETESLERKSLRIIG